jgi:hypothetical protein
MAGFTVEFTTTSSPESITLPAVDQGSFDATVYWGDTNESDITSYDDADLTHEYATAGTYEIEIQGTFDGWSFNNGGDKLKCTDIIYWGDSEDFDGFAYLTNGFYGCTNLQSLGTGSILSNGLTSLQAAFRACSGITSIPSGLLDNLTGLLSLYLTWYQCSGITSIPSGLLDSCCGSLTSLGSTWLGCSALTSIPSGLLDSCSSVTSLNSTWYGCSELASIPEDLFQDLTSVTNFAYVFSLCNKLLVSPWIFYNDGEQSTRFLNQSVNFTSAFERAGTPPEGEAPDLWNCDFGTETPTTTDCFAGAGNSADSLTNYKYIPVEWGGATLWLVVTNNDGRSNNPFPVTIE